MSRELRHGASAILLFGARTPAQVQRRVCRCGDLEPGLGKNVDDLFESLPWLHNLHLFIAETRLLIEAVQS